MDESFIGRSNVLQPSQFSADDYHSFYAAYTRRGLGRLSQKTWSDEDDVAKTHGKWVLDEMSRPRGKGQVGWEVILCADTSVLQALLHGNIALHYEHDRALRIQLDSLALQATNLPSIHLHVLVDEIGRQQLRHVREWN